MITHGKVSPFGTLVSGRDQGRRDNSRRPGRDPPFTLSRGKGSEERTNMMLKISRGTLACVAAAGELAAGCTLTGVSAANAATDKPA